MVPGLFLALASALLLSAHLVVAQLDSADQTAIKAAEEMMSKAEKSAKGTAKMAEKATTEKVEKAKNAANVHSDDPLRRVRQMEMDAQDRTRDTLDMLRKLDVKDVVAKASSWQSVDELESREEKALAEKREQSQKELDRSMKELEALPTNPTRNSTVQAKKFLAAASNANKELDRLDKQQARTMLRSVRHAEHAAKAQVRDMERVARRAARQWKAAGSKIEHATRVAHAASENVYEHSYEVVEEMSEAWSQQAEDAAEKAEGSIEDHFEDVKDEVVDRIERMQKRSDERRQKSNHAMSTFAKTRMNKEGRGAKSFLEAVTTSDEAMWTTSFAAGLLASLAGMSLILRRRQPAAMSAAPLLG